MNKRILPAIIAVLLLSGCAVHGAVGNEDGIRVYRLSSDGESAALTAEYVTEGDNAFDSLVSALNSEPQKAGISRAFPDGVYITDYKYDSGALTLGVNQNYAALEGIERTLCDWAAALSFCCLDKVNSVNIICGNRTLARDLRPDMAQLGDGVMESGERILNLCLINDEGTALEPKTFISREEGNIREITLKTLLGELDCISEDTRLVSCELENGTLKVELSEEFYATEPSVPETARLAVSAIVNTMTLLSGVDSVTLYVNSLPITGYGGYAAVWPMGFDGTCMNY